MSSRDARVPAFERGAVRVDIGVPTEGERIDLWRRSMENAPSASLVDNASIERIAVSVT